MTGLSAPLAEWLAEIIPQDAAKYHGRYPLVPAEDFEQELWATALSMRDDVERLWEQGSRGLLRLRLRNGIFRLIEEDDRYRRAAKAAAGGYSTLDECFYSAAILKVLIPWYLDNGTTERPPKGKEQPRVSGTHGSGDYLAMMLDIGHAMKAVSGQHRRLLERYYSYPQHTGPGSGGWTHAEIASAMGTDPDVLRMRRNRALGAVRRELGGRNPWQNREAREDAA